HETADAADARRQPLRRERAHASRARAPEEGRPGHLRRPPLPRVERCHPVQRPPQPRRRSRDRTGAHAQPSPNRWVGRCTGPLLPWSTRARSRPGVVADGAWRLPPRVDRATRPREILRPGGRAARPVVRDCAARPPWADGTAHSVGPRLAGTLRLRGTAIT